MNTPERWRQIEDLYHAASERADSEREGFLAAACGEDAAMRAEVESLLRVAGGGDFLEGSPLGVAAESVVTLKPGDTLGTFKIIASIGRGGMGQVWKARDPRLGRNVAIKISAQQFSHRFEREARSIAALNHPNICTLHDVGPNYLVMELVEGPTLAERIAQGPIPLREALDLARQISDALEAAHEKGIIHRDLKPSNIMVASSGAIKILDFGLAKSIDEARPGASPAASVGQTRSGVILGTASYMSPEQAYGKPVDHRSDIFSFGAVLYCLLSGKPAFPGESLAAILASVLNEEPEWTALPAATPPGIRKLLQQCLRKDRKQRLQAIGDARIALEETAREETTEAASEVTYSGSRSTRRRWLVPVLCAVIVLLALLVGTLYFIRPARLDLSAYKFTPVATDAEPETMSSWSPDGKSIAYLRNIDGRNQVMVRNLSAPYAIQLTKFSPGVYDSPPFFSRDGEQIYFIAGELGHESLWAIAVVSGEPRAVLSTSGNILAATISPDGKTLAFWQVYTEEGKRYRSLFISSPPGATPRKYAPAPFRIEGAATPNFLRFAPGGSQILLSSPAFGNEAGGMWSMPWPDGPGVRPHRIFSRNLPKSNIEFDWMPDSRHICLSDGGGRLYLADTHTGNIQQITASGIVGSFGPAVSPDGKRIVFSSMVSDTHIVEVPVDGSPPRPLLATARIEMSPSWSAAGDRLAFITNRNGQSEIWLRSSDGQWERPVVRQGDFPDGSQELFRSVALSPDSTQVAYFRGSRLWVSPASGGKASEVVAGGKFEFGGPSWSPDGHSLVYMAGVEGVYKLAIARVGSRQTLAVVPGDLPTCRSSPVWSPDGRWIACGGDNQTVFLVSPDGARQRHLPSPVTANNDRFVLVWSRDAARIYIASSISDHSRLDEIDVRSGRSRRITEYGRDVIFRYGPSYAIAGSLSRDEKSFATTVSNRKVDLWMLEGFPQPGRRLF